MKGGLQKMKEGHNCSATQKYLLRMIKSALNKTQPDEKPSNVKFEDVFDFARFHNVANIAYYSVERLKEPPMPVLLSQWKEVRDKAIVREIIQNNEISVIIHSLSNASIAVLPLKGAVIKNMYPSADMRVSADIDILIHKEDQKKVKEIMMSLGYTVEHFNMGNHDVYHKPPIMNVEIHTSLFAEASPYYAYYNNKIWEKTKPCVDNPFLFELNWSDFYIYMIVHLAKHFYGSGTGIRSVIDVYIFLKQCGNNLNQQYLTEQLKMLNLNEFRIKIERVAEDWFDCKNFQIGSLDLENYILSSGTYGTTRNRIKNQLEELKQKNKSNSQAKIQYIIHRLFMDKEKMKCNYPILKKVKVLLPLCWVNRIIKAAIYKRDIIKSEIRILKNKN